MLDSILSFTVHIQYVSNLLGSACKASLNYRQYLCNSAGSPNILLGFAYSAFCSLQNISSLKLLWPFWIYFWFIFNAYSILIALFLSEKKNWCISKSSRSSVTCCLIDPYSCHCSIDIGLLLSKIWNYSSAIILFPGYFLHVELFV